MDAPEKIYITPHFQRRWFTKDIDDESIEYIRKDAFIEKAVDYIANNMRCDGYTLQTKAKFIKDFKKYMEG